MRIEAIKTAKVEDLEISFLGETRICGKGYRVLYGIRLEDEFRFYHTGVASQAIAHLGTLVYSDGKEFVFYEDLKSTVRNIEGLLLTRMSRLYRKISLIEEEAIELDYVGDDEYLSSGDWDDIEAYNYPVDRLR